MGAGYSSSRSVGEILTNSYACFPVLSNGSPVADGGAVEFVISARASVSGDGTLEKAQAQLHPAVAAITQAIVSGKLV